MATEGLHVHDLSILATREAECLHCVRCRKLQPRNGRVLLLRDRERPSHVFGSSHNKSFPSAVLRTPTNSHNVTYYAESLLSQRWPDSPPLCFRHNSQRCKWILENLAEIQLFRHCYSCFGYQAILVREDQHSGIFGSMNRQIGSCSAVP